MSKDLTNSIIENLKKFNLENNTKNIYIPSLGKGVKFSPLVTKHQKMLIESEFDNQLVKNVFNIKLFEIIKETCTDKQIVDMFTILDKEAILIQMRYYFVSKEYDNINLKDVLKSVKELKVDLTAKEFSNDSLKVGIIIPTMLREYEILKEFSKFKNYGINFDNFEEFRDAIGTLYTLELVKYISSVVFGEDKIVFDELSIESKLEVVEYLPKDILDSITDYIETAKRDIVKLLDISDEVSLKMDSSLFL